MAETSGGAPDAAFELAKRRFFEGLAALQAGRLEDAERAFLASLEAVPGRVSTLLNLGTTRLRLRRPVEAIAAADTVLATQPGDVDALAIRAVALARMGLHTQALGNPFDRRDLDQLHRVRRHAEDSRAGARPVPGAPGPLHQALCTARTPQAADHGTGQEHADDIGRREHQIDDGAQHDELQPDR